jgi:hypothetical protein
VPFDVALLWEFTGNIRRFEMLVALEGKKNEEVVESHVSDRLCGSHNGG